MHEACQPISMWIALRASREIRNADRENCDDEKHKANGGIPNEHPKPDT
jgi:hypothetical protein